MLLAVAVMLLGEVVAGVWLGESECELVALRFGALTLQTPSTCSACLFTSIRWRDASSCSNLIYSRQSQMLQD